MVRSRKRIKALVVEGGGMRGVFSAGVLDAFGENNFDPFDLYIGVSAGACNLASHLAGQYGRNYHITKSYSATSKFISLPRFIAGGHYMDLDWLWENTIRDCRLDLKKIFMKLSLNSKEYIVVGTSVDTGYPIYIKPDESNLEHYIKVSSSLPVLYRNRLLTGTGMAIDGGIADPIPVLEAYHRGADEIVVIRSRCSGYIKKNYITSPLYSILFKKFPALARTMRQRAHVYNEAVRFINSPPQGVVVKELSPSSKLALRRTTKSIKILQEAYNEGYMKGKNFAYKQI